MGEEKLQKYAVKAQRAKNRKIRQQATATAAKPVAGSTKHAQKKVTRPKEAPLSLLSDEEETEGGPRVMRAILGRKIGRRRIVLWILMTS